MAAFERALCERPLPPRGSPGVALVHLRQNRPAEAAEAALDAIGFQYFPRLPTSTSGKP